MKKQPKSSKEAEATIRSLKKLRATDAEAGLLKSAHKLLSLQLNTVKKIDRKLDKKDGIIFYDSRILPLPAGVRPAAVETARLKYQIGDRQLQISLYPVSPERYEVIGHLGRMTTGKVIDIMLKTGRKKIATQSNEFQIFRFQNVHKATYQLEIKDGNESIAKVVLEL